jgi:hypothetical protein
MTARGATTSGFGSGDAPTHLDHHHSAETET